MGVGCSAAGVGVLAVLGIGIGHSLKEGLKCGLGESCGSASEPISLSNGFGQAMLVTGVIGGIGLGLCITGGVLVGVSRGRGNVSQGALRLARVGSGAVWLTPRGLAF